VISILAIILEIKEEATDEKYESLYSANAREVMVKLQSFLFSAKLGLPLLFDIERQLYGSS